MPIKNKTKKISGKKYYKFVSVFFLIPLIWALFSHSLAPIGYFFIFGLFGMLGEILFSEWWTAFYEEPLYVYTVEGIVHRYSARINFIPWGGAGLISLWLANIFFNNFTTSKITLNEIGPVFYSLFIVLFFAGFGLQFMFRAGMEFFRPRSFKFKKVNALNYILFLMPFLLGLIVSGLVFNKAIIWYALAVGLFASFVEYLYGKSAEYFFGKRFWIYIPLAVDRGHFTLLSIIPFSIMGFYFWAIYGAISFLTGISLYV